MIFCREIAYKHMNTDYTATRMLGYLYRISNPRPEDVVDEMLAILSDRNAIIQKKNWNMPRQRSTGYTGRDWNREENRTVICLKNTPGETLPSSLRYTPHTAVDSTPSPSSWCR